MGLFESRMENNREEDQKPVEIQGTPILTPGNMHLKTQSEFDPRSPSNSIVRTPIEFLLTPKPRTTGHLNQDVQDSLIIDDPRSPAIDFVRTPLVVPSKAAEVSSIGEGTNNLSTNISRRHSVDNSTPIVPRLEKSVINSALHKRKSFAGVLETNIDFTETDLDVVIQNKIKEHGELLSISQDIEKKLEIVEESYIDASEKIPISVTEQTTDAEKCKTEGDSSDHNDKNHEDKSVQTSDDKLNLIDVQNFNKKLVNLIHDEDFKVKKNRTPLGIRDGNAEHKKNNLKVSDKPRRKGQAPEISKIPVFKDNTGKKKINIQCENTPPRTPKELNPRKIVVRRSMWDPDNTLFI